MALPLPYRLGDDDDPIQGNFDKLKNQFPLSRRHMKIETPHDVGGTDEPAFQNSWVNYDTTTYQGLRFWKDPMGLVHIEGSVKNGTVPATIFTLPEGYRPGNGLEFATLANGAIGRFDVAATGNVVAQSGSNARFVINCHFKQES